MRPVHQSFACPNGTGSRAEHRLKMASPFSGLKETRPSQSTRLEKDHGKKKQNKQSINHEVFAGTAPQNRLAGIRIQIQPLRAKLSASFPCVLTEVGAGTSQTLHRHLRSREATLGAGGSTRKEEMPKNKIYQSFLQVFAISLATSGFGLFANTNIQAAEDIVWVTTGSSIGKYSTDGTTAIPNFITPPLPGHGYATYLGGILVSGPTLYVATIEPVTWSRLYYLLYHPPPYIYVIATYNAAEPGNVINSSFFAYTWKIVPRGMALSGTNLYVATEQGQVGSISKIAATGGGITSFISSGPEAPYALAVGGPNGNVLYVTDNYQNSNGEFYISTYTADTGALINANFIQIPTGGLYGLAIKPADASTPDTLYVSVYSGSAPGVYTYKADTGQLIRGPFVSVNEPWGIAIGSPRLPGGNPTLYVASYQDSAIYEFDAIKGGQPCGSIKLSGAPTNITVEPASNQ